MLAETLAFSASAAHLKVYNYFLTLSLFLTVDVTNKYFLETRKVVNKTEISEKTGRYKRKKRFREFSETVLAIQR